MFLLPSRLVLPLCADAQRKRLNATRWLVATAWWRHCCNRHSRHACNSSSSGSNCEPLPVCEWASEWQREGQLYQGEAEHVASEEVATLVRCSMLQLRVASGTILLFTCLLVGLKFIFEVFRGLRREFHIHLFINLWLGLKIVILLYIVVRKRVVFSIA